MTIISKIGIGITLVIALSAALVIRHLFIEIVTALPL